MTKIYLVPCLLIVNAFLSCDIYAVEADLKSALKYDGNLLRLNGDYEGANRIQKILLETYPNDPVSHIFNLNTLIARLSWDQSQTRFDKAIKQDANATLSYCLNSIDDEPNHYLGYYQCGQARFILTYLHAIRGNYYQAGRNGNLTIKMLERTLELKQDLADAKMYLGMAYYYANNLPSYLRALSWFLWFIPTGSNKSHMYIEHAIEHGEYFKDVAKYAYVDLLVRKGQAGKERSKTLLEQLVSDYPQNPRYHFRLIELLLNEGLYQQTVDTGNRFLAVTDTHRFDPIYVTLVKLWITRAHLALNNIELAQESFMQIDVQPGTSDSIPQWSISWHLLTRAQLLDLADHRSKAMRGYEEIVALRNTAYMNPRVVLAAKQGIKAPYIGIAGKHTAF